MKAQEAQEKLDAPVCTPPFRLRLLLWWNLAKDIVQGGEPADLFNRDRWRPRYLTVYRPDLIDDARQVSPESKVTAGIVVPEHHKHRASDCERNAVDRRGLVVLLVRFQEILRNLHNRDTLRANLCQGLAPTFIDEGSSTPKPYSVTEHRFFDSVEAVIFRIWYDALGRIKKLRYKCGLYGSRRK